MQENTCVSNPLNWLLPWLSNYSPFVLQVRPEVAVWQDTKAQKKKKKEKRNIALNTHFNPTFQLQIDVSKPFPPIETFILAWIMRHQVWEP